MIQEYQVTLVLMHRLQVTQAIVVTQVYLAIVVHLQIQFLLLLLLQVQLLLFLMVMLILEIKSFLCRQIRLLLV